MQPGVMIQPTDHDRRRGWAYARLTAAAEDAFSRRHPPHIAVFKGLVVGLAIGFLMLLALLVTISPFLLFVAG
jgi:hypothetical protein